MFRPRETEESLSAGHCRGQAARAARSRPRGDDVTGSHGGQWRPEGVMGGVVTEHMVLCSPSGQPLGTRQDTQRGLFDGVKQCPVTRS